MALDSLSKHRDAEPIYKNSRVIIYSPLAKKIYHLKQRPEKIKHLPANAHATHDVRVDNAFTKKSKCIAVIYVDSKGDFWLLKTGGNKIIYCDYILSEDVVQLGKDGCLMPAQYRETNEYG
jgi:hypothetical protein